MKPAEVLISELVLREITTMPPAKAAEYLRALSSLSSDEAMVEEWGRQADRLEALDRANQQLLSNFTQKHS